MAELTLILFRKFLICLLEATVFKQNYIGDYKNVEKIDFLI